MPQIRLNHHHHLIILWWNTVFCANFILEDNMSIIQPIYKIILCLLLCGVCTRSFLFLNNNTTSISRVKLVELDGDIKVFSLENDKTKAFILNKEPLSIVIITEFDNVIKSKLSKFVIETSLLRVSIEAKFTKYYAERFLFQSLYVIVQLRSVTAPRVTFRLFSLPDTLRMLTAYRLCLT